jgi:hypothetical protein
MTNSQYIRYEDIDMPIDEAIENIADDIFVDSTFDIIAQREQELGCPLALH